MDLLLSTANNKKEFYIELLESKFYFPGDTIKGILVLNLDKPTKTNHIRLTFTGTVQADGSSFTLLTKTWFLATDPDNDGKAHILEAQTHRLPFEFEIPTDAHLPSSVKISSGLGIRYLLHAVHDRPFVPERLSSQAKKEVRLLEYIDITEPEYCARGHVYEDVQVLGLVDSSDKVRLSLTLPTYSIVRGDVLPLVITMKHHQELVRPQGIKVYLIRRVFSGKNRPKLSERKSIKSNDLDIDITCNDDDHYEQTIHTKLLIPTNTPPTVSEWGGRPLSVDYSIRVVINLNDPSLAEPYHENYIKLESSVVIGTWPKASLSIDDDDDDDDDDASGSSISGFGIGAGSGIDDDVDGLGDEDVVDDDSLVEDIHQLGIRDRDHHHHLNKPLPSPADGDHSSAHVFEPMLQSSFSASSSSLQIVEPTMSTNHSQQHLLSSSPSSTATIIDPLSRGNNYIHRQGSSASSITIDPTAPMKPNRKDSISSIPSPSSSSPPAPTPATVPSPPRPLMSRPPPPLPQPSSSSSTTTSSSFAMPDISAYLPTKQSSPSQHHQSPPPPPPITNYLSHPSHHHHHRTASASSNTSSHSASSPSFTPHPPIPSPSSSSYLPTVSMPTPYPPPPPPVNNSTYPPPGGFSMPMPMNIPNYNTASYNTPPPPPPPSFPSQYNHHYPPPQQQQQYHQQENQYYPPPPPPYGSTSSWS